jgi:hypothetical protein
LECATSVKVNFEEKTKKKECKDFDEKIIKKKNLHLQKQCTKTVTKETIFEIVSNKFNTAIVCISRSQWPRGLRRRSVAARLLRSWV